MMRYDLDPGARRYPKGANEARRQQIDELKEQYLRQMLNAWRLHDMRAAQDQPLAEARERLCRYLVDALRIPRDFAARIVSSRPKLTPAADLVNHFRKARSSLLLLSGKTGCGKTFAACSALAAQGFGLFIRATEYLGLYPHDDNERAFDKRVKTCGLLVLDDVGREYMTEKRYEATRFDEIITVRMDAALKTIVTTNLDADGFKTRYQLPRLFDRIRGEQERGGGWSVAAGDSLRGNNHGL
jgi:DNA replication protein DnaC